MMDSGPQNSGNCYENHFVPPVLRKYRIIRRAGSYVPQETTCRHRRRKKLVEMGYPAPVAQPRDAASVAKPAVNGSSRPDHSEGNLPGKRCQFRFSRRYHLQTPA